jgi:putative ABC transport system permease protein
MLMLAWARGLVLHRPGRLLGAMAGVGITVSLLACLGVFIVSSAATMTVRALANLPIDWQILLNSGADEPAIRDEIERVARPTALARWLVVLAAGSGEYFKPEAGQ